MGRKLFYGWVIVGACFFAMVAQSFLFSFGVFYKPLIDHFGWSVADVSLASSISSIVYIASVLPVSWAYQKMNVRLIVMAGSILMGSGLALSSQVTSLWQLYFFYGIVAGIGNSTVWVPFTSTIMKWFTEKRGVAMAIALCGHGVGSLVAAPLLAYVIVTTGWKMAFLTAGVSTFVIVMLAGLLMKASPETMGLKSNRAMSEHSRHLPTDRVQDKPMTVQHFSVREALSSMEFWLVYSLWVLSTIMHSIYSQHIVLFAIGLGISVVTASVVLGAIGFSSIIGRLVTGSLLDRIGVRWALILSYGINAASAFLLLVSTSEPLLFLFAFMFGFSFGGRTTLEVPLAVSFAGLANLGIISGVLETAFGIGGFIGPYLAGLVFDTTGRYYEVFLFCGILSTLLSAITIILKPAKTSM
jgi:OFA family oxalate/formate antiporter-like MFS transporter